jgi:hypothetical protein
MAARKKKAIKSGRAVRELDKSLLEAARRERTAIACMQGLLAGTNRHIEPEEAAVWAVQYADALLDELDDVEDDDDEEEYEDEDEDEDDEEG